MTDQTVTAEPCFACLGSGSCFVLSEDGIELEMPCEECAEQVATAWDDAPHVCPGCYAVAEPCAPGCIDDEMAREREDAVLYGDHDRTGDEDEEDSL